MLTGFLPTLAREADNGGKPSTVVIFDSITLHYGELNNAYFYLSCNRADDVPAGATEEEKNNNLYAMKLENGKQLTFGYAENEPVTAEAIIEKGGKGAEIPCRLFFFMPFCRRNRYKRVKSCRLSPQNGKGNVPPLRHIFFKKHGQPRCCLRLFFLLDSFLQNSLLY